MLKPVRVNRRIRSQIPAAFRRLCVETRFDVFQLSGAWIQPPSGGCVLKPPTKPPLINAASQPPSGGCVLKRGKQGERVGFDIASRLQAAVC